MKTTLKLKEILDLNKALHDLNLEGQKFAYSVARNINVLKPEIESLQVASKEREDFTKYNNERLELAKKFADKDERGKPVIAMGKFQMTDENELEFEKEFETLKETHKEALDYRNKQNSEIDELMEKEVELEFHKIKLSDVPEKITSKQMTSIFVLIEE